MEMMSVRITVHFIKEKDTIIAYAPALDLSAYGETLDIATKNFEDSVEVFFEQTKVHGTLEKVLQELGWERIETSKGPSWSPPQEIKTITESIDIPIGS